MIKRLPYNKVHTQAHTLIASVSTPHTMPEVPQQPKRSVCPDPWLPEQIKQKLFPNTEKSKNNSTTFIKRIQTPRLV